MRLLRCRVARLGHAIPKDHGFCVTFLLDVVRPSNLKTAGPIKVLTFVMVLFTMELLILSVVALTSVGLPNRSHGILTSRGFIM